ncbi:MAG: hypothetical protein ACFB0D_15995 [Phormidesmis sp.]
MKKLVKKAVVCCSAVTLASTSSLTFLNVAKAVDRCNTPAIQEALDENVTAMITDGFKFPTPVEVTASIDRCLYYEDEDFNLVTARVTWIGASEAEAYDTTIYAAQSEEAWDYRLLGASNNARDYMFSVSSWFPSLTGTGRFDGSFTGPRRGPFR